MYLVSQKDRNIYSLVKTKRRIKTRLTNNLPSTQLSSAVRNVSISATVLSSTDPGLIMVFICRTIPSAIRKYKLPNANKDFNLNNTTVMAHRRRADKQLNQVWDWHQTILVIYTDGLVSTVSLFYSARSL